MRSTPFLDLMPFFLSRTFPFPSGNSVAIICLAMAIQFQYLLYIVYVVVRPAKYTYRSHKVSVASVLCMFTVPGLTCINVYTTFSMLSFFRVVFIYKVYRKKASRRLFMYT